MPREKTGLGPCLERFAAQGAKRPWAQRLLRLRRSQRVRAANPNACLRRVEPEASSSLREPNAGFAFGEGQRGPAGSALPRKRGKEAKRWVSYTIGLFQILYALSPEGSPEGSRLFLDLYFSQFVYLGKSNPIRVGGFGIAKRYNNYFYNYLSMRQAFSPHPTRGPGA